jgi:hypothetical protein
MSLIDLAEKYQMAQGTYYLVDKKRTPTCSRPLYIYFISMVVIKWIKDFEVLMEWISNVLVLEKLVLIENA